MTFPRDFLTCLAQFRARRGFGVHSPYAFRFINDVVNEDRHYGYTAYKMIDDLCRRSGATSRCAEMRRFYRLLAFGDVAAIHPGSDPLYRATAAIYVPSRQSLEKDDDLHSEAWVVSSADDTIPGLPALCRIGTTFTIWPDLSDNNTRRRYEETEKERTCGLTFTDGHAAITVATTALPRQTFRVKI